MTSSHSEGKTVYVRLASSSADSVLLSINGKPFAGAVKQTTIDAADSNAANPPSDPTHVSPQSNMHTLAAGAALSVPANSFTIFELSLSGGGANGSSCGLTQWLDYWKAHNGSVTPPVPPPRVPVLIEGFKCCPDANWWPVEINLLVFTENLLENTDGVSRDGSLRPSRYADARSPDDVIAF